MNGPPVNPVIGQRFQKWTWDGSRWRCAGQGMQIIIQTFNLSGPYTPSPGLITTVVEAVGGGAGGGGALGALLGPPPSGPEAWMVGGGGGSSGGYSRSALPAALVAGGVVVTIGQGGLGGPPTEGVSGGPGGMTTFGALVVANGGLGGNSNVIVSGALDATRGQGGARNILGSVGDLTVWGNAGEHGDSVVFDSGLAAAVVFGGRGGGSFFQSAEVGVPHSATGAAGIAGFFGAGGGGAASAYASTPVPGGAGGNGIVVATDYCFIDAVEPDDCGGVQARVARWRGHEFDD
jgi:hypothetical protein